jgi:hypothetical protein
MAGVAIRWDLMALSREQELFPHFGEAHFGETRTAIFPVEQVEYGGHDRTPLSDHGTILSRHHFKPSSLSPQNGFMS